jgi:trichohyalin
MEIVKFEQFGLDEQEAQKITKDLPQILSERDVLAEQYNEVIKMDIEDPATAKTASDLRKLIKANRTKGVEAWHKANKDYFLRGGQFVDAIKRKETAENIRMEDALEEIEKYQERKEAERLAKLNEERVALVAPYVEDVTGLNIAFMEDDVFQAYLTAKKNAYEAKIAEAKRVEDERLENERIEREEMELSQKRQIELRPYYGYIDVDYNLRKMPEDEYQDVLSEVKAKKENHEAEQEKIRLENERLKKEAEEKEKARLMEEELRLEKERAEAKKRAIEEAKKQAELDRIKAELEAERKRKLDEEIKRQQEEEAKRKAEEDAKKAPEKIKIMNAINDLQMPPLELDEYSLVYSEIVSKFESFKIWAKKQIV